MKMYGRKIIRGTSFLFLIVCMLSLQSCMNIATTGAEAVYNRHSIQKNLHDQYLTMQAYRALYFETDKFKNANIIVSTYHGEMLLAGQTPWLWQKSRAEEIVRHNTDVEKIYNLITVKAPSSSLTRVSDAWITTKIKTKFLASNDMDASQVKVITENGTVYLMGILLPEHAEAAVDLARNTVGVQRVVKIFSYMRISKKA